VITITKRVFPPRSANRFSWNTEAPRFFRATLLACDDAPGKVMDFEGTPVPFEEGDTVLAAVLRTGLRPWRGCLCTDGDCPYCLVTLKGVSYVRACRAPAVQGMRVESHPSGSYPALPP